MSLLNANGGNRNISTIHVTKVYRNTRTESFGDSVMNDFASAVLPAAKITSAIYRKKALKAIEKRNRLLGNESDYIYTLCNYNAGNNISAAGMTAEANFYNYIIKYCKMETRAFRLAVKRGGLSPKLAELLDNPPHPSKGHISKMFYTIRVNVMWIIERFKKPVENTITNE